MYLTQITTFENCFSQYFGSNSNLHQAIMRDRKRETKQIEEDVGEEGEEEEEEG